jgi:2-polyprenyl-3-methyl-5-hydroxy-6-metoxy-1,4-benzoquinol methylase
MKPDTITKLINLNHSFYNSHSKDFSGSRNYNWEGFEKLSKYLFEDMQILDVGCGNARFARFLNTKFNKFKYLGIDNSEKLLDIARANNYPNTEVSNMELLQDFDISDLNLKYDLIVALGVMHHIPSQELRIEFINNLVSLLSKDSKLVLSFWNFQDKIDKNKFINPSKVGIDASELEEGDYILTWERGELGYRYAHLYSEKEILNLTAETGLKKVENFKSDSKNGKGNNYIVLSQFI